MKWMKDIGEKTDSQILVLLKCKQTGKYLAGL